MKQYKILVTNDDGYEAKGLYTLVKALREIEDVVVSVVAPANEKSACGHSLTLTRPLKFVGIDDDFYKLDDATPADCIYVSLATLFEKQKPDLVVSGINKGSNMGEDITYSGTCAGAMEGVLHDVPSIAISQVVDFSEPDVDYSLAAKTIKKVVQKVKDGSFPLPEREFLNINIPPKTKEAKIVTTYAGYRYYENDVHRHTNPRGEEFFWLGLHPLAFKGREFSKALSDHEAIEKGYISITPVMLDMSAYKSIEKLKDWCDAF